MIRYSRVRRGYVQAPVLLMRHPATGRCILLIGMMHVGEESYYQEVQRIVAQAEAHGYLVQFEGVHPVPESEKAGITEAEQVAIAAIESTLSLYGQLAAMMNWVDQKAALVYRDYWQGIDINILELVRLTGPGPIVKMFGRLSNTWAEMADDPATPFTVRVALGIAFRLPQGLIRAPAQVRKVVIGHRNLKALSGIFEALPSHNVAIIWGAAHLPGIAEVLKDQGFEIVETQWLNIGKLPPIFSNLKGAFSAAITETRSKVDHDHAGQDDQAGGESGASLPLRDQVAARGQPWAARPYYCQKAYCNRLPRYANMLTYCKQEPKNEPS